MKKNILFFLVSFVVLLPSYSQQLKSFTSDSAVYLEEIKKYTDNYISDEQEEILDEFIKYWISDKCTPDDRIKYIRFSNLLLRKNGRPSPHFINYFETLLLFSTGNYNNYSIADWEQTFQFFLENRSRPLKVTEQFLKLSLKPAEVKYSV